MKIVAAFVAVFALANSALAGDFPFEKFERSNVAGITSDWAAEIDPSLEASPGSKFFDPRILRRVVRFTYRGEHRPIDTLTATFLKQFQTTVGAQSGWAELYEEEYLFSDGTLEHWLPVQKPVAAYFTKELQAGQPVDLYVIAAGGVRARGGWKWVFAVQEFKSLTE